MSALDPGYGGNNAIGRFLRLKRPAPDFFAKQPHAKGLSPNQPVPENRHLVP